MAEPGIIFDHVWKKFRRGELHDSLRDLLPMLAGRFRRGRKDAQELGRREFWALHDVSFEVKPGEALGIIGANGAGKSTTLNTICGIVKTRAGRITFDGRDLTGIPAHAIVKLGLAQSPEHFDSAHPRQHQVQQDEIRRGLLCHGECLSAIFDSQRPVSAKT